LHQTDANKFHPVAFGVHLISTLFKLFSFEIKERAYITNVNPTGGGHLDKLLGKKNAFELLRSNASVETYVSDCWPEEIANSLLYH
jgi:hypothetical protein